MLFMFSYTRSLLAGGFVLLAVICFGLWLRNRTVVLNELTETNNNLQMQISKSQTYPVLIADYLRRLETLRIDTEKITSKFVGQNYTTSMLMRAIVEAASLSGMEMTNASKHDKKTKVLSAKGKGFAIEVLSYAITLKGSYTALVKFLQNLAAWNIGHKIESIEIAPTEGVGTEGRVEVSLILSVFLVDQPMATKDKQNPGL